MISSSSGKRCCKSSKCDLASSNCRRLKTLRACSKARNAAAVAVLRGSGFGIGAGGVSICLSTDAVRDLVAGNGAREAVLATLGLLSLAAFLIPFPLARFCLCLTLVVLVVA